MRHHFLCQLASFLFAHAACGNPPPASGAANQSALDAALDAVAPESKKWAAVCIVSQGEDGKPSFTWHDYRNSGSATNFWPASTIKLYAAVAALELLTERQFPLDTVAIFEHREKDGRWILDCARSMREMLSEVFRRSSNEDYTLLLRLVGIDRINSQFLISERGFPHSALMRGYVTGRPYGYVREEPQRLTLRSADGAKIETFEHTWSGRFYAEERGCTIIDAKTGNVTTPRELAECLRRVLFHECLTDLERYRLDTEQLEFLRQGGGGLAGLENKGEESGPSAWTGALETLFPNARFFHKCGVISNYALEVAFLDDSADSGKRFILVPVINAGSAAKPTPGEKLIGEMVLKIGEWVKGSNAPVAASATTN
ncbi:MAG: serine hydrolase [Verrucomicrobiales bacterium]